jgi:hypothetical protein
MSWINRALAVAGLTEGPAGPPVGYGHRADAEFYGEDRLNFRKPRSFEEVEEIADLLKEEQPVVLNLEETGADERRRVVDFLFGVIYAVDGDVCRVAEGVFIFTPNRISIDAADADVARRAFASAPVLRAQPLRQNAGSM